MSNLFLVKDLDSRYIIYLLGIRLILKHKCRFKYQEVNVKGITEGNRNPQIIVSLTSHPARINTAHKTINTLLNQSLKPDKIILWLSEDEFPKKENDLPEKLIELKNFGLNIEWCENIKSYKKLLPALKKYPNDIIITADDDVYYEKDVVESLYNAYLEDNSNIYVRRAVKLELKNNKIKPVSARKYLYEYRKEPSYLNQLMGGSGCLYPPHCFNDEVFKGPEILQTHDDVFFWAMSVLNNKKIKIVKGFDADLNFIEGTQKNGLINSNKDGKEGVSLKKAYKILISKYPQILNIISEACSQKQYTTNDIEIVILTGGRLNLFKETLQSVLNQTVKGSKITVVINEKESDGTEDFVKSEMQKNKNITYFKQDSYVLADKNLDTAKSLVSKDYVIFFHDDDLMHPQYLEYILKLLNKHNNIDLICTLKKSFTDSSKITHKKLKHIRYKIYNKKADFVTRTYFGYCTDGTTINFPNIVYKSANLKYLKVNYPLYGKIADKPTVIDFIQNGSVIQILEKEIFKYRIHSGQDTNNHNNGPYVNDILNLNLFFKKELSDNWFSKIIFKTFSIKWLKSLFYWGSQDKVMTYNEFLDNAIQKKALSPVSIILSYIPFKLLLKPINYISREFLTKRI